MARRVAAARIKEARKKERAKSERILSVVRSKAKRRVARVKAKARAARISRMKRIREAVLAAAVRRGYRRGVTRTLYLCNEFVGSPHRGRGALHELSEVWLKDMGGDYAALWRSTMEDPAVRARALLSVERWEGRSSPEAVTSDPVRLQRMHEEAARWAEVVRRASGTAVPWKGAKALEAVQETA